MEEEGKGEIFKSAAGSHSGTTLVSTITPTIRKVGQGLLLSVIRLLDQELIEEMKLHSQFLFSSDLL